MEGTAKELLRKESKKTNYSTEKLYISVTKNGKQDLAETDIASKNKSIQGLFREEMLKAQLNELKKEKFSLQASTKAWDLTLKNKLDEFKEADLKLNEVYNEIWSERENFCSQTEKFNDEYGILSEWWERQIKVVSDLEKLEKERAEEKKRQQETDELNKETQKLKRETEAGKQEIEVEGHSTEEGCFRQQEPESEVCSERFDTKKAKILVKADQVVTRETETKTTKNKLFSMVDLEKVRIAKRIKHPRCKNHLLARMKFYE